MAKQHSPAKGLNIALWIAQIFLAFIFFWSGYAKGFQSVEQMSAMMAWAPDVPVPFLKFLSICEFLGGIGLILPSLLRIKPKLTIWAAIGCATLMLLATIFHISRGEFSVIWFNIFLGLVALFIIWGRSTRAPIQPK